jgi:hypothetical protein
VSMVKRTLYTCFCVGLVATLVACGGGPIDPPPPPPPPASPNAVITATGAGALVLHPSLDPRFGYALVAPIRIRETGGGRADWYYLRIALFREGVEVERAEIGSDTIQEAGVGRINANSDETHNVLFRLNSSDFDVVRITLGFGDVKDGRQFTVEVPFNTFTDVGFSPVPLSVPAHRIERL